MALKRSQENSGYESDKKQKLDSKDLLQNNEDNPELVIDLTKEYTGPEKRLDMMVHACRNGQKRRVHFAHVDKKSCHFQIAVAEGVWKRGKVLIHRSHSSDFDIYFFNFLHSRWKVRNS